MEYPNVLMLRAQLACLFPYSEMNWGFVTFIEGLLQSGKGMPL
jgi:hypothetical protein